MIVDIVFEYWFLILLFFFISILYSSAGFGGGSSYLAILALTGFSFYQIRSTALICNIFVVLGNLVLYSNYKIINWKKTLLLASLSVPMSYLGGYLKISENLFFILLGFTLLFASTSMWFSNQINSVSIKEIKSNNKLNVIYGGFIGFVSGIIGIGGGIFLAPFLHFIKWDKAKKIAASSSLFILVNSISGLFGQVNNPNFYIDWNITSILVITVIIGGQIGARVGILYFSPNQLKKSTAILIAIVSLRIIYKSILS